MDVDIKLIGADQLLAKLRDMPQNIARNALKSAVGLAAGVIRDEAISRIGTNPKSITGTLQRSLYTKQIRELSGPEKQTFYVGARQGKKWAHVGKKNVNKDAFYAKWVELGHFTRRIKNSNRGERNNAALEAAVRSGKIKWVQGRPFLVPAFIARKETAIRVMGDVINARLVRYQVYGK